LGADCRVAPAHECGRRELSPRKWGRVQSEVVNISEYPERAKRAASGKPMLDADACTSMYAILHGGLL